MDNEHRQGFPIIITVLNQKGGVYKTTSTINIGASLASRGYRVLLIDFDPQQNLTVGMIGEQQLDGVIEDPQLEEQTRTLYEALIDEGACDHLIRETTTKDLDILPSHEDLVFADLSLAHVEAREHVLRTILAKTDAINDYDFVLIDNNPSIGLLVVNSLVASQYFLVPVSAEFFPLMGLRLLGTHIGRIQEKLAPNLRSLGVFITAYARSENICRTVERQVVRELGEDNVFDTRIRVNTKAKAAPSVRKTIFQYEKSRRGRGTEDYTAVTDELLERLGIKPQDKVVHG